MPKTRASNKKTPKQRAHSSSKPNRRQVKLRSKLTLIFGAAVIIAVAVSSVMGYISARREIHQEVDNFLEERAESFRESILGPSAGITEESFIVALQNAQANRFWIALNNQILVPYESWAQVSKEEEVLLYLIGAKPIPLQPRDVQIALGEAPASFSNRRFVAEEDLSDLRLRVYSFQLADGYAAPIGRDLSETVKALNDLLDRTLLIRSVVTVATAVIGWFLGRRIMKPVEKLAVRTEGIAQTQDLSTPVEVGGGAEVSQLAESFNRMLEALNLSRQQQQQLIADAGHELRTPLTSLRANIEMLSKDMVKDPEDRVEMLSDMEYEIVEFSKLVDELIELNSDPHREEERELVSLSEIAEHIADRARGQTRPQIEVIVENPVEVTGYARALERAVRNLVENAIKFSPDSAPVEIRVDGLQLEVRDHGDGIPPDQQEKIFDRFYRSVEAQGKPGSGLGLAITRQIVERHGGKVWARNHPYGGAVVGFRLPETSVAQDDGDGGDGAGDAAAAADTEL